ncbi:protein MIGRI [Aquitalea aquatica]|uniref:Uncharacterized protein n=1 Tax=Aquitalea aquatica TaxID=3044273 RepID=A0A838XZ41_9NEIS|nr:hypothetical protein [Aquitalea magnusonii]MBA4708023.1 hypothetical protein [Aquitalea magnusonii]
MIGRLFRLVLLFAVLYAIVRWLLDRRQRASLREFISTLATALLAASAIFVLLYWLGFHQL